MSFTEQTDPNAPVTPPPAEAPVIAPKVSGGIAPDVKLPGRKVFLTAPQLAEIKEEDILGGTVSDSGDAATRQRRGFDVIFQGQQLVNKSGVLERGHIPRRGSRKRTCPHDQSRQGFIQNALASRGLYGKNGRPSGGTGFGTEDISVTKEFKRYANGEGLTVEAALDKFLAEVKPYVAPRKVIRTTAKQDIRSVLQKTTQEILGRSLSPNEIEKFVKTYERMEITEAMGGVRAPNLAVAAEEQVQQQFGPEAQAVGALGLFDILDRKIKGQA
jgi:hypothetical protein